MVYAQRSARKRCVPSTGNPSHSQQRTNRDQLWPARRMSTRFRDSLVTLNVLNGFHRNTAVIFAMANAAQFVHRALLRSHNQHSNAWQLVSPACEPTCVQSANDAHQS
ncbi:hypothetical protein OSTOST_09607 [Ostertagia ostertagi]